MTFKIRKLNVFTTAQQLIDQAILVSSCPAQQFRARN